MGRWRVRSGTGTLLLPRRIPPTAIGPRKLCPQLCVLCPRLPASLWPLFLCLPRPGGPWRPKEAGQWQWPCPMPRNHGQTPFWNGIRRPLQSPSTGLGVPPTITTASSPWESFFWERGYEEGDRGRPPSSFLVGAQAIPTSVARKGLIWEKRRPALFLDRDGIINVDRGYIHLPRDITLYEEVCDLIRFAKERGWWVFVLTNQSGVARGKFTCQQLEALHRHLGELLAQREAPVDDWFYCPLPPSLL